jgi:Glycosyl hydrolase family 26
VCASAPTGKARRAPSHYDQDPLVPRKASLRLVLAALCAVALGGGPAASSAAADIALGVNTGSAPATIGDLDAYATTVGARPAIVMWYQAWSEPVFVARDVENVARRGAVPLITWEPARNGAGIPLREIALGLHDEYVRTSARTVAAHGGPIMLRFAHEMNLAGSPWGPGVNGNTAEDYRAAWQRVVRLFREHGATNAQWVFSPNVDYGGAPFAQFFPGDAWVDWVGLDGYNWGSLKASGWTPLGDVFGSSYDTLAALSARPMMIAETASTESGGDKAAWIRQGLLRHVPERLPRVRAVVWFDRQKETDWRVNSSAAALAAFREVVRSPLYGGRVTAPAPAPSPAPGGGPAPAPAPATRPGAPLAILVGSGAQPTTVTTRALLGGRFIRATRRLAKLRIRCATRCSGRITMRLVGRRRRVAGLKKRFRLTPGRYRTVHVRLRRVARSALRRKRRVTVSVVVRVPGAPTVRRRLRMVR